jgi:hypothetical protein
MRMAEDHLIFPPMKTQKRVEGGKGGGKEPRPE